LSRNQEALHRLALRLTPPGGLWAVKEALRQLVDNPELLDELQRLADSYEATSEQKGITSLRG
jgi:hypothetical protein